MSRPALLVLAAGGALALALTGTSAATAAPRPAEPIPSASSSVPHKAKNTHAPKHGHGKGGSKSTTSGSSGGKKPAPSASSTPAPKTGSAATPGKSPSAPPSPSASKSPTSKSPTAPPARTAPVAPTTPSKPTTPAKPTTPPAPRTTPTPTPVCPTGTVDYRIGSAVVRPNVAGVANTPMGWDIYVPVTFTDSTTASVWLSGASVRILSSTGQTVKDVDVQFAPTQIDPHGTIRATASAFVSLRDSAGPPRAVFSPSQTPNFFRGAPKGCTAPAAQTFG